MLACPRRSPGRTALGLAVSIGFRSPCSIFEAEVSVLGHQRMPAPRRGAGTPGVDRTARHGGLKEPLLRRGESGSPLARARAMQAKAAARRASDVLHERVAMTPLSGRRSIAGDRGAGAPGTRKASARTDPFQPEAGTALR